MVEGAIDQGFKVAIGDGEHVLFSDMSKKDGGADTAMDPHRLLESALTGCTLMTMELVAKHKGYSIGNTTVCVEIEKEGETTTIKRIITFDPSLTAEQKEKMTVIANKCPIHKILKSNIEIPTEVRP